MIEAYQAKRQRGNDQYKRPPSPAAVNRGLALKKTLMKRAIRDGYLERNPVNPVRTLKESNERSRVLEPGELGPHEGRARSLETESLSWRCTQG